MGNVFLLLILAVNIVFFQPPALANTKKIAILPFEIHSQTDIEYMGEGIYQMLASRLSWKDHVQIVETGKFIPGTNHAVNNAMDKTATALGADYVLSGSITEFSGHSALTPLYLRPAQTQLRPFSDRPDPLKKSSPSLTSLRQRSTIGCLTGKPNPLNP